MFSLLDRVVNYHVLRIKQKISIFWNIQFCKEIFQQIVRTEGKLRFQHPKNERVLHILIGRN